MAKIGRKRGFALGNLIGILGAALCFLALGLSAFWTFTLGTFFLGVGFGFGTYYRFAAVEVAARGHQSKAISLFMSGGVLAAILGPNLAMVSQYWLPDNAFQGAFLGIGVVYCISLITLKFIAMPDRLGPSTVFHANPTLKILQYPGFFAAVLAGTVSYTVMTLLMTVTPMAMLRCGFEFSDSAVVIKWHVLGMFVPAFFTGHLINLVGTRNTILLGGLLFVACIFVNYNGFTLWHFKSALLLLGVGWNFMFIGATNLLTNSYLPENKAKAQAINELVIFGSATLTSLLSGWLEISVGWKMLNVLMLPFIITVIWVFLTNGKELRRLAA